MRVVAAVDESDVGEVKPGQPASFTVTAYPARIFHGIVTEVRNSPVVIQDVVTYGTVVQVENPDLALRPGMTASVRIRTAQVANALRAPNMALHFTPPGQSVSDEPGLWTLQSGELRRVEVRLGISDGERTEIRAGSLRPGASVLVELTPAGRKAYGIGR
jgi:HlyD family secretion protein